MNAVEKYFWVIALAITVWNAYSIKSGAANVISEKPELADVYRQYALGYLAFYSLPWLIMGAGIVSGRARGVFDFLMPCEGNPFVTAFHAVMVAMCAAVAAWVWLGKGAEFFRKIIGGEGGSLVRIRLTYTVPLLFVLVWIWAACKFQG